MQEEIEITKQNPELKNDINLFKLILTPLELYSLKYFLSELHPLNVRDIYTQTINFIFTFTFASEEKVRLTEQEYGRFLTSEKNSSELDNFFQLSISDKFTRYNFK